MDRFGEIIVLSQGESILPPLAQGFRQIYTRSPVKTQDRVCDYRWVSPYQEKGSKTYLVKESGYLLMGNLEHLYYNPRYTQERLRLRSQLSGLDRANQLIIAGGGSGVYGVYLARLYRSILMYDTNPWAQRYARLNLTLNKGFNVGVISGPAPRGQDQKDYLSMIPTRDLAQNLAHRFKHNLVFYALLRTQGLKPYQDQIQEAYGVSPSTTLVRPYGPGLHIYRFLCHRPIGLHKPQDLLDQSD